MKLVINNKEIVLDSRRLDYIYPYLIRFLVKNNIYDRTKEDFYIPSNYKNPFIEMLENILLELLNECYVDPNQRQRTINPSRFQKINFKDKVYVLNYRTDIIGIYAYSIYDLIYQIKLDL